MPNTMRDASTQTSDGDAPRHDCAGVTAGPDAGRPQPQTRKERREKFWSPIRSKIVRKQEARLHNSDGTAVAVTSEYVASSASMQGNRVQAIPVAPSSFSQHIWHHTSGPAHAGPISHQGGRGGYRGRPGSELYGQAWPRHNSQHQHRGGHRGSSNHYGRGGHHSSIPRPSQPTRAFTLPPGEFAPSSLQDPRPPAADTPHHIFPEPHQEPSDAVDVPNIVISECASMPQTEADMAMVMALEASAQNRLVVPPVPTQHDHLTMSMPSPALTSVGGMLDDIDDMGPAFNLSAGDAPMPDPASSNKALRIQVVDLDGKTEVPCSVAGDEVRGGVVLPKWDFLDYSDDFKDRMDLVKKLVDGGEKALASAVRSQSCSLSTSSFNPWSDCASTLVDEPHEISTAHELLGSRELHDHPKHGPDRWFSEPRIYL